MENNDENTLRVQLERPPGGHAHGGKDKKAGKAMATAATAPTKSKTKKKMMKKKKK